MQTHTQPSTRSQSVLYGYLSQLGYTTMSSFHIQVCFCSGRDPEEDNGVFFFW